MSEQSSGRESGDGRGRLFVRLVVVVVLVVLGLYFFDSISLVALAFLAAASIAALLRPVASAVARKRWISGAVVGLSFWLLVLLGLLALGWTLKGPIQEQVQRGPEIRQNLNQTLEQIGNTLNVGQPLTVERLSKEALGWLLGGGGGGDGGTLTWLADQTGVFIVVLVLIVFGSMYLLAAPRGQLASPVALMLPMEHRKPFLLALDDINVGLRWWVIGTAISVVVTGIGVWIGYWAIGLKFAVPLAILAGVSAIVPTLGAIVVFVISVLVALSQGTTQVIGVFTVYLAVQILESYVIQPLVMKKAIHIPLVVTLFTIVLWARLLGTLGLLLALPINLVIWAFVERLVLERQREETAKTIPPA